MLVPGDWVAVGIDNGGTANNGTVFEPDGRFLVDTMAELPSLVREGPDKAIQALVDSFDKVLAMTGVPREKVRAVGLDTPGPASVTGVLATGGATKPVGGQQRGDRGHAGPGYDRGRPPAGDRHWRRHGVGVDRRADRSDGDRD